MMVLPRTMIGMLIRRPITTNSKLPCAAPATPSMLSKLMAASAIMIVRTAAHILPVAVCVRSDCPAPPSSEATSWYAIHTSISPPTSCRPGSFSSHTTASVASTRSRMAARVPPMIARERNRCGSFRAASAITIALSPESTTLITMMASSAVKKSADSQSIDASVLSHKYLDEILHVGNVESADVYTDQRRLENLRNRRQARREPERGAPAHGGAGAPLVGMRPGSGTLAHQAEARSYAHLRGRIPKG